MGFHHVAYRCRDAHETVEFYSDILGMRFKLAIAEDRVPSTGEPHPYMHIFLEAGGGNILAFFELPSLPGMDRDRNTPAWVQHIALKLPDTADLQAVASSLKDRGLDVLGPVDHGLFRSIYWSVLRKVVRVIC